MKQKLLSILLLCTLLIGTAYAQSRTVSGKVISSEDGLGLPGVSVMITGASGGTQTDGQGNYSISIPAGSKSLTFRYIGFSPRVVTLGTTNVVNVTLVSDAAELEDVVITGYSEIRRDKFAGSSTVLKAEATTNKPVGSFNQVLQGKVPGMVVNSGSGQPGANAAITIRGVQSIQGAGAQPLYIIDGVAMSANDFQSMNPNDFETVTVLKDANAAAVYGARAGVGVIVVTTKQGTKDGNTLMTAKVQNGITMAPDFSRLNLMSTAELLTYEERVGRMNNLTSAAFGVPGWVWSRTNPQNKNLPEAQLLEMDRKLDSVKAINTDLRDVFFRQGKSQMYEVNARGGDEKTQFFVSGGYFQQDGIDRTSDMDRFTGRVNLTHQPNSKLKIQWNTMGGYSVLNQAIGDMYGNSPINPFQMIYRAKPYDNPYRADGTLNFGGGGSNLALKSVANVLERGKSSKDILSQMKVNTGLTLSYDILEGLQLRNTFGLDASTTLRESYIDPASYSGSTQTYNSGYARENNYIYSQLANTTSLNYSKTLSELHSFAVGAYFEGIRVHQKALGFTLYNLNPALPQTGQGASPLPTSGAATMPQNASSARSGYGIRSYFAIGEYTYDDRITINANVRRDGTSRIVNPTNKEITTWSAGVIWNAYKESFMRDQNIFSNLNLRFSFGEVPNIGSISTSSYTIHGTSVTNYAGTQVPAYSTTSYPGSTISGLAPSAPGNADLRIEKIQKLNLGLDFGVWNNRARFTFDVYSNKTKDLFVSQPLSSTTAFSTLDINAGIMTNKGIEAMVAIDVVRTFDWQVSVGANHAINNNKIVDLGLVDEYFLGTFVIRKGLAYGSHYNFDYLGADPDTGRPTYRTEDGGTTTDIANAGKFADFGTYLPKHVGGFNLDLRYKRFSIGADFSYQFDVVRSNNTRSWITDGTQGYASAVNQSRELLDNQWQSKGDHKWFPSPQYAKGFTSSDLENAKFLRFRNLTVGYDLPEFKLGNGTTIIKGANIYLNAHNLAVWSPWTGVDPEDSNNISLFEYPNPRMIVFGVDIKF